MAFVNLVGQSQLKDTYVSSGIRTLPVAVQSGPRSYNPSCSLVGAAKVIHSWLRGLRKHGAHATRDTRGQQRLRGIKGLLHATVALTVNQAVQTKVDAIDLHLRCLR